MSLTEETAAGAEPVAPPAVLTGDELGDFSPPAGRVLLVWDAPNLDMGLGSILGRRPTALERPRFDALGRWLLSRTAEVSASRPGVVVEPEATVFTNIAPGSAEVVRPLVDALRNVGFAVFAKPKIDEDSDVDTLGGLIFSMLGRVPARGELIHHPSGIEFEILDADPRRVKKVKIHTSRTLPQSTKTSAEAPKA